MIRHARPYWPHITAVFLLGLLSTPLALLAPIPLKIAVDSVLGSEPLPPALVRVLPSAVGHAPGAVLGLAVSLTVIIALLSKMQELSTWLLQAYAGERLDLDIRTRLFRHVQRLSLSYHDAKGSTESSYRIQYDASAIRYVVIDGVIPLATATVTLLSTLGIVLLLDWQLALVGLAVSPVLVLITRAYRRTFRSQSHGIKLLETSALAVIQEALASVRVVKAFGQEDREEERFVDRSGRGMQARLRFIWTESTFSVLVGLTTALGSAAVLFIGIRHVQSNLLTLGQFLLVMSYLAQLYAPLTTIGRKVGSLQSHLAGAERVFALLDEAPDVPETTDARSLSRASGSVTFDNVSFAYGSDRPALQNLSFAVDAGTSVGIVGATGAGKTTLVSLLMRFADPTQGRILLDGVDLRGYKLVDLRQQFAVVLQEPVLFSASLAENIAYARPLATEEEIVAAAKAANAHDFIVDLPRGYATEVGERGMQLSGGERQRIALARAFLKDAPILILDEPTSAVDVITEAAILDALGELMRGRTTFLITHRPHPLAHCDVRLQIEAGRLLTATSTARAAGQTIPATAGDRQTAAPDG